MKSQYIKLLALFFASYLAILLYPLAYIFSPLYSVQTHQFILGIAVVLTIPIYLMAFRQFGLSIIRDAIDYGFRKGNILQKVFAALIIFLTIGVVNAMIVTALTTLQPIPFAIWNPIIEAGILIICLFSLLLQLAVIQSFRERVPSAEEITEAFDRAETMLKEAEDVNSDDEVEK